MASTRRLAAILAADVAGSSRLMEADEEGTLSRLRVIRAELFDPAIAAHNGRLVKTTGDGLLVEFGSVVDALRCATEVQGSMAERNATAVADKRIEFRIGIHQGDILVEDGDIFGDGVNVAARLEGLAPPGGICVSARVQEDAAGKLDLAFEDMGDQALRNILRPVRAYRVTTGPAFAHGKPALALPDKPSIAVLPFQNMTGDAEQDYFVDGVVEDITTALSRLPWLFVIARNSAFTYKGRAVDVKQVGRELGVHYVLEGSVRKTGNRVHITGQLIDAASGSHIWANRFDSALDDIFELQDQMASSVVGAIEPKLQLSEIKRALRKPTESLDAYDLYLRALSQLYKYTEHGMSEAVTLLKRALEIDPSYAPAAAMVGRCHVFRTAQGWGPPSSAEVVEGVDLARLAIELGKDDPDALRMAARTISLITGEHAMAAGVVDRALSLNPNSAHAWMTRGWVSCSLNKPGPAIAAFQHAIRLSPFDPVGYRLAGGLALAYLGAGRHQDAEEWANVSLREMPRYSSSVRIKCVSCAHLGRIQEARHWLKKLLELQRGLTIASFKASVAKRVPPEFLAIFVEGFLKAGLPKK